MSKILTVMMIVLGSFSARAAEAQSVEQNQALDAINRGRWQLGRKPLVFDARLTKAAQLRSDQQARDGDLLRHSTLQEMLAFGFPEGPPPSDARFTWRHNVSEGCLTGHAEGLVEDTKQYVNESVKGYRADPEEPHNHDFAAGWNRVGFASNGIGFTIMYGLDPTSQNQTP